MVHLILLLKVPDKNLDNNPFHPISIEHYPKLFEFVLTRDGLIFFNELKRKYILGKKLDDDQYNKLRLCYVYYAAFNKNKTEVKNWQHLCMQLDQNKIKEKNVLSSQNELLQQNLIVKNPLYLSGLYYNHIKYVKEKLSK